MKQLRIYADTSVFGGSFDEEFEKESKQLFEDIKQGKFLLVISETTERELNDAPPEVQEILGGLPPHMVETVSFSDEIRALRDAYLKAAVVGPSCEADAEHIAAASIALVDSDVSWNFKHIVHYEKIRGFQAINLLHGYEPIQIVSPKEVVDL